MGSVHLHLLQEVRNISLNNFLAVTYLVGVPITKPTTAILLWVTNIILYRFLRQYQTFCRILLSSNHLNMQILLKQNIFLLLKHDILYLHDSGGNTIFTKQSQCWAANLYIAGRQTFRKSHETSKNEKTRFSLFINLHDKVNIFLALHYSSTKMLVLIKWNNYKVINIIYCF